DRAGETRRRLSVQRRVRGHFEPRHHSAYFGVVPTLIVELGKRKLAVEERDGGEEIEAVVGRLARLWVDTARIAHLAHQRRFVGNRDGDVGEPIDVAVDLAVEGKTGGHDRLAG